MSFEPQGEPLYCPDCGSHLDEVHKKSPDVFLVRCHDSWYEVRAMPDGWRPGP